LEALVSSKRSPPLLTMPAHNLVGGAFAKSSIGYRGLLSVSFGLSAFFILALVLLPPTTSHGDAKSLDYVGAVITTAAALQIVFRFRPIVG
jgi:hypothetical protein